MRTYARVGLWKNICAVAFAGALVASGAATNVEASPITFYFSGKITYVTDLGGTFNTSQTISGSYTFESTTSDSLPLDSTNGDYIGALQALTFTVNGYNGSLGSGGNDIVVENNFNTADDYTVRAPATGANVAGLDPSSFFLFLQDVTMNAFSNDLLPLTLPALSQFSTKEFSLFFGPGSGPGGGYTYTDPQVSGVLTSLSPSPVPEPATMLLLGSGLLGLVGYGRKKFFKK